MQVYLVCVKNSVLGKEYWVASIWTTKQGAMNRVEDMKQHQYNPSKGYEFKIEERELCE